MVNFGEPLFSDILKRGRRGDGEADEENIGLRVGEGSETVVIFLSCGIEESQSVWLVANPDKTLVR